MIRGCIFVAVFLAAIACLSAGMPLWPLFLLLACVLSYANWRYEARNDLRVTALIGAGIVFMLLPIDGPVWHVYAIMVWLLIADYCRLYNPVAAVFVLAMPVGYLCLLVHHLGYAQSVPVWGFWTIVEVSGVASLLSAGGSIDQLIGDIRRALDRRSGPVVADS